MSGALESLHRGYVSRRRLSRLSHQLARVIPRGASVLDVGCGDGALTRAVAEERGDLALRGIDVLVRPHSHIPVIPFDGLTIPFADASFDAVMLVDVLHHTEDPMALLREAWRVARRALVVKDHLLQGFLAGATLRFMDRIGNARYGVALPYNYWPPERWREAFSELGLAGDRLDSLQLYPWPASWLFDRSLHFLVCLEPSADGSDVDAAAC